MGYSRLALRLIEKASVQEGQRVRVDKGSESYEGMLLPRQDSGDADCITIKLDSGYTVGIRATEGVQLTKVAQHEEKKGPALNATLKRTLSKNVGVPEISLISTGGTISARVDYKSGAVKAAMSPQEIFAASPELEGVVNFKNLVVPFTMLSENMGPLEWGKIARATALELNGGARGVIVTHGTDTLHYTAAALSFMLKNLKKPVALVGAQRSPDRGSFDGAMNLLCGSHYAGRGNIAEVAIVMHESSSDGTCIAIRGTKARKMHTSRRDAFRPVNDIPLARIWPEGKIEKLQQCNEREEGIDVIADDRFEPKVAMLKAYPGADPSMLEFLVEKKYRGVLVEATALGHVPTNPIEKKLSWLPAIKNAIDSGVLVAFATQCLYGRTAPYVYEPARVLSSLGVHYCADMLPETAYIKLGCALGRAKDAQKAKELMDEDWAGEMKSRHKPGYFLA